MSGAEMFFMVVPFVWLCLAIRSGSAECLLGLFLRWMMMVTICLILSFVMIYRLSGMIGGRWHWGEVVYYGWLLASFFSLLQIFKKWLSVLLQKIVPRQTVVRKIFYYGILFVVMVPFFLAMTSVHRMKVGDATNPKITLGLDYEDVFWKTADGLQIKGWFVPAVSDQAVLITHGLGANKSNFIEVIQLWNQLGFNVLIFDFRGHGESAGHTVTFGYRERLDIVGGWDYLTRVRKFPPQKIIGYGVSFGGAALIHAAQEKIGFRKLIIDSAFASLDDMAAHIVQTQPVIPYFLRRAFKEIGLFFIRLDLGYDIRARSPDNVVGQLGSMPILFIHGRGDPLINWTQSERLYARAVGPKQLCILNTQGHFGTFHDPEYGAVIAAFVKSAAQREQRGEEAYE